METVLEKIIEMLDKNSIPYTLTEHEPVRTSEEAARARGVSLKSGAKSMVLKANNNYYLIILPADKQIDWKKVKNILNVKDIRLAAEEEAEAMLRVKMGSVPPFADIFGIAGYYDKGLFENEYINFNPGSIRHSIQMRSSDLQKITSITIVEITK